MYLFCTVLSASVFGVESIPVHVEADVGDGLPSFSMVGFLSTQVKEAQERVRTALKNSGIRMEPKRITVNLAPADLRKSGTAFDLPIAVAIAAAYGKIAAEKLKGILIAGELSLNGEVLPVCGSLLLAEGAAKMGCHTCILPQENVKEGAAVQGIRIIGVCSLTQTLCFLKEEAEIEPGKWHTEEESNENRPKEDFADISGQESAKRAAEIAVAGFHNLLMVGPPGSGKSMIARRIPTILPKMTWEERLELTKIYSIMGLLPPAGPILKNRPFRAPHHTITAKAMAGGGMIPRPGEVSLAHNGVLFLDELAEFSRDTLEVLRQPMEEKQVSIARGGRTYCFPANFMVVAAMNPCPCGYYPDLEKCTCTHTAVQRYLGKISGPLLDRIDLTVEVPVVRFGTLKEEKGREYSAEIRDRICGARQIQQRRYQEYGFLYNSQLTASAMKTVCRLGKKEQTLMKNAFEKLDLSVRSYYRTLKVARTIADLAGCETITCEHLGEALCYRSVNKKYWTGR